MVIGARRYYHRDGIVDSGVLPRRKKSEKESEKFHQMKFVWDPDKEKNNVQKHKIDFTEACYVFADPYSLTLFDERHTEDEDRWVTSGIIPNGKTVVVVHTYRKQNGDDAVRIISARKATKGELRIYRLRRR